MVRRGRVEGALLVAFASALANDAWAAHKEDPIGASAEPLPRTSGAAPSAPRLTLRRDVYFDATSPRAELQVRYPEGWRTLCVHPGCLVDRAYVGAEYRVAGPGLVESRSFSVYANPGTLHVRADTASSSGRTAGAILIATGGVAMLVGAGWVGLAAVCVCSKEEKDRAMTPGAFVLAGGAVSLIAGIVVLATTHTGLRFGRLAEPPRPSAFRRGLDLVTTGVKF